jgi:hypothetical protein
MIGACRDFGKRFDVGLERGSWRAALSSNSTLAGASYPFSSPYSSALDPKC